jgi:hypothetical protein
MKFFHWPLTEDERHALFALSMALLTVFVFLAGILAIIAAYIVLFKKVL